MAFTQRRLDCALRELDLGVGSLRAFICTLITYSYAHAMLVRRNSSDPGECVAIARGLFSQH